MDTSVGYNKTTCGIPGMTQSFSGSINPIFAAPTAWGQGKMTPVAVELAEKFTGLLNFIDEHIPDTPEVANYLNELTHSLKNAYVAAVYGFGVGKSN